MELGPHPGLGPLGDPPERGHSRQTEAWRQLIPGGPRGGHEGDRGRHLAEWEIPRVPLQYERAVLAGRVVQEKLRTATATAVRGRVYDVVAHQHAAMPEQQLAPEPAGMDRSARRDNADTPHPVREDDQHAHRPQ